MKKTQDWCCSVKRAVKTSSATSGLSFVRDRMAGITAFAPLSLMNPNVTRLGVSQEKLPPRMHSRGMQHAARVVGQEIRDFTHKVTGKDLATLRDTRIHQQMIGTANVIVSAAAKTKYDFMHFNFNLCSNLDKFLAPDGPEGPSADRDLNNYILQKVVHNHNVLLDKPQPRKCISEFLHSSNTTRSVEIQLPLSRSAHHDHLDELKTSVKEESKQNDIVNYCSRVGESMETSQNLRDSVVDSSPSPSWNCNRIADEKFHQFWQDSKTFFEEKKPWSKECLNTCEDGWEVCMQSDLYTMWKKDVPDVPGSILRVQATFPDIAPKYLHRVQTDCQFRKSWDNWLDYIKVLAEEPDTGSELVQWVTRCPYPITPREYIYNRRSKMVEENKTFVMFSEISKESPSDAHEAKAFRVNTYSSKFLLRSHHGDFNKEGLDFILMYHEDLESRAPTALVNRIAKIGVVKMLDNLYSVSKKLQSADRAE